MKKKATWIWYPGDFEVWLGNKFNNRRTERGAMFPPFWKQDSHWPTVVFTKTVDLARPETVSIVAEGLFSLAVDGKLQGGPSVIPAGCHTIAIKVWNQATPPALFIAGKTIQTDSSWQVTYEDKIWIDENGVAHGSGIYVPAASWCFDSPDTPPSQFRLPTRPLRPVCCDSVATSKTLYDFGRETFGYLRIHGLQGMVRIYYGESLEEALDKDHCETLDMAQSHLQQPAVFRLPSSKAFRFVCIEKERGASYDEVTMDCEYTPFDERHTGSFSSSDEELNSIWKVAAYTLDLTTREFFCDGIKRDRWVWSGDAIQSYLMNYYLHFDSECVKRTIRQLRGKDPVTAHVNTIMDYTFYWFKSISDYYQYTGDLGFVREMWPKMQTMMDYVLKRLNADGMAEGKDDDWVFVDWTDFPMHKRGTLCFEQILLWKSLQTMAQCSDVLSVAGPVCCDSIATNATDYGATNATDYGAINGTDYDALAATLHERTMTAFWSPDRNAFLHALEDGGLNDQVTKFPNMFAIIYDFVPQDVKAAITKNVLLNPTVPAITTPYMRFYELEALCQMGHQATVLQEMKAYWGGMLREGATTFWEKYNPEEHGPQHLAMYGRPYGKSLCHAWGASPLYIIGRYFLGVKPTKPGYEEYEVSPVLGGLSWMDGEVPTPFGKIRVKVAGEASKLCSNATVGETSKPCSSFTVKVFSTGGKGTLVLGDIRIDIPVNKEITVNC